MASQSNQVFFDPTGRRSLWVTCLLAVIVVAFGVIVSVFLVSTTTSPALPSVPLSLEQEFLPALTDNKRRTARSSPVLDLSHPRSRANMDNSKIPRFAFYTNWDRNSFLSLRSHADQLDVLLPEWLHLVDESGGISPDDAREQKFVGVWLAANAPHLQVIPVINNFNPSTNEWHGEAAGRMLRSKEARAGLIVNMQTYLANGRFAGIAIDFKGVPTEDQVHLIDLVIELKTALQPSQQKVLVVLPAYEQPANYLDLVEAADQLILLAYDQHAAHESTGPVAAQGWFEALLDRRFEKASGDKLVVAIGSYAIDWSSSGEGTVISIREAWDILDRSGAKLAFDGATLNATFSYSEQSSGEAHTIWMLDGVTMFNQIAAALAMEPAGIALWRLGTEDPTVWSTLGRGSAPNQAAASAIGTLDPGPGVTYRGKGEILKFMGQAQVGRREVKHLVEHNLITDQSIVAGPQSMMISRSGFNSEKVVALTFDDGPTQSFTPAILDILKKLDVKASFFVVGTASAIRPDILKRIYGDGHDVGNHTFTHPDLSKISNVQLDLELNATQRVFESKLGIRSVLFRPPFVKDIEPETQLQARTLQASAALGYITIGQKIDPLDWGRPGADEIVNRTVEYASRQIGNIVLLHDGGGDRSQTVEALPRIIEQLRTKGFRFVTVHELLGLSRNEIMPQLTSSNDYTPAVNDVGISLAQLFIDIMNALFLIGIVLGVVRLLTIAMMACWQRRHERPIDPTLSSKLSLAVIVPAYNEDRVIAECIHALLQSKRRDFEILVVDDGSTDRTCAVVRERFSAEPRVRLLVKENGGKSTALNHAILATDVDIVVCIDADTRLARLAIDNLMLPFGNERVGAVAGVVTVGNRSSLLSRFQALEYITAQNMDRRAFALVNGIGVVAGAIGAWRRKAIVDVGMYGIDTCAEDADLTLSLERAGWLVVNEPNAIAVTEAPDTVRDFNKQRFRWMFGTLQVAFKHAGVYFQKGAWGLKAMTIPNIIVFQFLFTLISPVMDMMLLAAIVSDGWSYAHHSGDAVSERTIEILGYWALFQGLELAFAAIAVYLHGRPGNWRLLPLSFIQRFCYRQLIFWISLRTLLAVLRGELTMWGKARRRGLSETQSNFALGTAHAPAPAE